jgi:hypothetical protein
LEFSFSSIYAVPTKNTTARTTAEAFLNNFVVHYGFPKRIHSDQGANFEGKLIKELCELAGPFDVLGLSLWLIRQSYMRLTFYLLIL